ncbi:MAG TPA: DNA repair protein RecO [Sphaerochaeta sp.]|jgi:DNA repair protein RecO (recombination protein O)|nr:DNA repair protein RecO [Spirochaetota bacterium]NLV60633.1 DNA repair protein RecO [Spirochaetales bacterium]HOE84023.1 DNA repair protein RecO [Sphaerochaeta sp.]HOQ94584.1 DNA repair protein RecO [Sphaerochaeta sp.]HPK47249.1 DNA repair protein RecO [Sphaerochaeta sp.]
MERNITTLGIVLHSRRWGQTNRRLKLLSVDLGIVDVVSYGAQKSLKAVKAEVFCDGQFFLYHNPVKGDYTLKDLKAIAGHEEIREDLALNYTGLFFCEILIKVHGGENAAEYRLLSKALDLLTTAPERRVLVLIQFIHRLSEVLGIRVDLDRCPVCDRAYERDEIVYFSSSAGSQCCQQCANLERTLILPPGARRYLSLTATMDFEEAVAVDLNPGALKRIKAYMLGYAQYFCPSQLTTLSSGLL